MKMKTFFLLTGVITGIFLMTPADAAPADSTRLDSVLLKGTWLSGLNGYLASTSQNSGLGSGSWGDFINNYNFEIKTGVVHSRRIATGLFLNAQRISNEGNGTYESDLLGTGIWSRYFIGSMPYGRFYPEISVFYANFHEQRNISFGNFAATESLSGQGVGLKTLIGFMYFVNRNIGLDVNYGAQITEIWGKQIDFGNNEPYRVTAGRVSVIFSFGFVVMLNEFFF